MIINLTTSQVTIGKPITLSDGTVLTYVTTITPLGYTDGTVPEVLYRDPSGQEVRAYGVLRPSDFSLIGWTINYTSGQGINVAVPVTSTPTPPPSQQQVISATINLTVRVQVHSLPASTLTMLKVRVNVFPANVTLPPHRFIVPTFADVRPIPIPLLGAVTNVTRRLLTDKVRSFYDEDRALHTLLNFGSDYQSLITNWIYDPVDPTGATILVKMYRPLPTDVQRKKTLWISREVSPTAIDSLYVEYRPNAPQLVYLRPANRNVAITGQSGRAVENATLGSLLTSSSLNVVGPRDSIIEGWYTDDFNSTELNIDYSDFRNFVFYSSAKGRVDAFVRKLEQLEIYNSELGISSASLAGTGSAFITGSAVYGALQNLANERYELMRSFDGFERFLYYGSGSAYSSSLTTDDYQDELYYMSSMNYPKSASIVVPVASASVWYDSITEIANEYDYHNQNSFRNNVPAYLNRDNDSQEFLTFLDMIGHHFDVVKSYIDHMPAIYDRGNDPDVGLSPDLVWNIAKSFGIDLPNQYAIKQLVDYTVGREGPTTPTIYRRVAAETWKRILHNHMYMMKTKGTRESLRALINTYGVAPTTLQIRESVTPGVANLSGTFEIYEEQTNTLPITSGSYITIPWSTIPPITVETRFATTTTSSVVLLQGGSSWAVTLEYLTGSYGRMNVISGSTTVLSSSYMPIFGGEYYTAMLRKSASLFELHVRRTEDGDVLDTFSAVEPSVKLNAVWATPSYITIGKSGSYGGSPFIGNIDEFRMWSESLTDTTFDYHTRYPGTYHGNTTTSARDALLVRLSFNKPRNLGSASLADRVLFNESPSASATPYLQFSASGFANATTWPYSFEVITREVQRFAPNAGGSQYTSNNVVIADAPVLRMTTGSVPTLSRFRSMVSLQDQMDKPQPNNQVGLYFSITDAINDSIIRSIGAIDLHNLIGDPSDMYSVDYEALTAINELYWTYYAYSYNPNTFVDFVHDILEPLFAQAKKLIPARAKLLAGIVHEPHILERAKIQYVAPVVTAGTLTRNTSDTQNLVADAGTVSPIAPEAEYLVHEGTLDVPETTIESTGEYNDWVGAVTLEDQRVIYGEDLTYEATLDTTDDSALPSSDYATYDELSNKLSYKIDALLRLNATSTAQLTTAQWASYNNLLQQYKSTNIIDVVNGYMEPAKSVLPTGSGYIRSILPLCNFDEIESRYYFTDPTGSFAVPGITYVRSNAAILRDRGTWTFGGAYSRNDFVLQMATSGSYPSASVGDDVEFVCISTDSPFFSKIPPYLDTANWKAMSYIPRETRNIKRALSISGSITIAPYSTMGHTPFVGYHDTHFKNYRDTRLGTVNHQFKGCLQTDSTTIDGKPAVEVTLSAGDSLVVNNPNEPIQPSTDQSGPILSVE